MAPKGKVLSTRLPTSKCPRCGKILDCATGLAVGARPKPGDISVCIECGSLLMFTTGLGVRRMTEEEEAALPDAESRQVQWLRKAIATISLDQARPIDAKRARSKPHGA